MITVKSFAALVAAGVLSGCAGSTTKPPELLAAQRAYAQAERGLAGRLARADLENAHLALARAERSFIDHGAAPQTRDLGYIAERRALIAESRASTLAAAEAAHEHAAAAPACEPPSSEGQVSQQQLEQERAAREEAERRTQEVMDRLLAIEGAHREPRGVVITLSGAVIFPFAKSTLLPIAQQRLSEVAAVLKQSKQKIVVEGHTDSVGSPEANKRLSLARAEAVRGFLVAHGIASDQIAAEGFGEEQPVAENTTPEGRANNRRVEIVLTEPQAQDEETPARLDAPRGVQPKPVRGGIKR